jgi:hypothetical protein
MRRGHFRLPDPEPDPRETQVVRDPDEVLLPPRPVLDAGLKRFQELAGLHWPKAGGSITFDMHNISQLMMVLGLTYMAMKEADRS